MVSVIIRRGMPMEDKTELNMSGQNTFPLIPVPLRFRREMGLSAG